MYENEDEAICAVSIVSTDDHRSDSTDCVRRCGRR